MSETQSKLSMLVQELRNRRVFRIATVYVGAAFALIQMADILFPMLSVADWGMKALSLVLLIGFPLAVVLAWMFQFTPEGLRRSPKSGEKQSTNQKPLTSNAIIIVLLAVLVGFQIYPKFSDQESKSSADMVQDRLDEKSVAVLPFTSFTKTAEDESFADGIHDDILTQLSKIGDLKVISRTSVVKYKETTQSIPEIAAELGVVNLLEGSVRRAGDQIRIVAQLINAETDEHLWAETYDRKYADIFAIQSDVAQKIARALKATLTPQEKQYIEIKPTENQDAWELYMRAELLWDADIMERDSIAVIYEQAIHLDPQFLLPYTKLVRLHAWAYFDGTGPDPSPERMEKAKVALEKAKAIEPNAPETYLAQGYFYYYGSRDYEQALQAFALAQDSQPNNSDLFQAIAYVERRLGQWEQARENMGKAVFLDPNNARKVMEAYDISISLRDYSSAEKYLERWSAITSGKEARIESFRYFLEFSRSADIEKMQTVLDQLLEKFDAGDLLGLRMFHANFTRDYKTGMALMQEDSTSNNLLKAELLRLNGKAELAHVYYDSARIEFEEAFNHNPENWSACSALGMALSRLGKFEEAVKWGKQAVVLMPLSRDAYLGSRALGMLVYIYVACGYEEEALNLLEECLSIPGDIGVSELKLDPLFDPLRQHPRFQNLIQRFDI